jgi:hypothetical protein
MGAIDVEPAVRVRGLVRQHGKGESLVRAVDGVDLDVAAGRTHRYSRSPVALHFLGRACDGCKQRAVTSGSARLVACRRGPGVLARAGGTYRHPRQNRGQALCGRGTPGRRHVTAARPVPAAPAFSGPRSRRCGVRGTRTAPAG